MSDGLKDAADTLRQEAEWLRVVASEIEAAETQSDIEACLRRLKYHKQGEDGPTQRWARTRLKDELGET